DGLLATAERRVKPRRSNGAIETDIERDILKIAVVNRYKPEPPAVAFVRGFGLQRGALAASIAHDSHNIVAVGTSDAALCAAINAVIANRGGLAVAADRGLESMPLEVAGLMSRDGAAVAHRYAAL